MVGGTATGEHEENGYKLSWTATDTGANTFCSISYPPFSDNSGIFNKMHAEIETSDGQKLTLFEKKEGIIDSCFKLSGGILRIFDNKYVVKESTVFEVPLPYLNGADINLTVTPSATTVFNPVESLLSMLQ